MELARRPTLPPFPPGFFKGFLTMNALWLPWNLIYLPLYEASKRQVYRWQLRRQGLHAATSEVGSEQHHAAPPACRCRRRFVWSDLRAGRCLPW